MNIPNLSSLRARIEPIDLEEFKRASIEVDVLREDSLEEFSGGNKLRKLVPSLLEMRDRGLERILSFGGAYSNHIAALAEAGDFDGTVVFIFQPNEEHGAGARAMIDDGLFDRFPVDQVFAVPCYHRHHLDRLRESSPRPESQNQNLPSTT